MNAFRQIRSAYRIRRLSFLLLVVCTALLLLGLNACGQEPIVQKQSELQAQSQVQNQSKVPTQPRSPAESNTGQFFKWKNVNIQGMGYVTGLAIAPQSPHDVYIRTDIGGAYRFIRQTNQWLPLLDMFDSNFAKGGIGVESIAIDPTLLKRIYVVVNHRNSSFKAGDGKMQYKYAGEVMVSDNQGGTWKPTGLGKNNVFVGPNNAYRSDTGERLAVDPNKSGLLLYASRRDGLWKKNGEQVWTRILGGLPDPKSLPGYKNPDGKESDDIPGFTFVTFDKNSGRLNNPTQTIYVGVHGNGVWRSTNGGVSWSNIAGGNDPLRSAIASDGTLYVGFGTIGNNGNKTSGGVRQYKNGTWTDITPDGTDKLYSAVTVQLNQADTVMAISDKYVYRSTNGGKNWKKQTMYMGAYDANSPKDPVNSSAPGYYLSYAATGASVVVIDPSNPKQVWWTNGWGVARTDDVTVANPAYKWLMNNLEELDVNILRVPPKPKAQGGADLLSAVQDMIGFRHENRNLVPTAKIDPEGIPINPGYKWANPNWKVYPQPFPHVAGATGMDYAYKKPDYAAFVGFHQWQGFWSIHGMTSDNGKTWKAFESIPKENFWKPDKSAQEEVAATGGQIAMSPTNPQNMVWAPAWGPWAHYTRDGGKTWKLARSLDHDPKPEPYDPQNNDHIHYQALPKAWANSISPWVSAYILAADRQDRQGKTFYYFNGSTFYYSNDGGANWRKGKFSKFPTWLVRPAIVPNPTRQGDVWMSFSRNHEDVKGNKLYRSLDGGKTFSVVSSVDSCEFMTFGKGSSDTKPYIYVFGRVKGATKDAMYKSENMGKSWIQISKPNFLQFPGLTYLEGDMRSPNLVYAGLSGRGIIYGEGSSTSVKPNRNST
jgi:xyloglucan-specific exo-beta-1,4-glucanase